MDLRGLASSEEGGTRMKGVVIGFLLTWFLLVGAVHGADDWTLQSPASIPPARSVHGMAYIDVDQIVLFGGYGSSGYYDDTWVFDLSANTWTEQSAASSPSDRHSHRMTYIGGDQVVLFGGHHGSEYDDTWVYDLSADTWTELSPASSPSGRHAHGMAYIGGDQALLFGGYDGTFDGETWVFDLSDTTWTQLSPASNPSARYYQAMAYIGGDQVVLFGGNDSSGRDDETWVYDFSDNTWTQLSPASSPTARQDAAMAYIGGDQVVLFGGYDGYGRDDETWVFDLSEDDWTQDANTTQPSARFVHTLTETSMDGSSYPVLFGGDVASWDDQTWTFGGGDYLLLLNPMVLDIELTSATTARISWAAVTDATHYDVYRSSTAFFSAAGAPWQTVAAPLTQLDFTDGIGDTTTNYFFLGKARSATQASPESNIVGECDVALP
jgi:hypothetical protein